MTQPVLPPQPSPAPVPAPMAQRPMELGPAPVAPPPKRVPVVLGDGSPGTVDEQDVPAVLQQGGKVTTPAAMHEAALQERYEGPAGFGIALGNSALEQFSAGTLNYGSFAEALGLDKQASKEAIETSEALHPWAAGGGGMLGIAGNPVVQAAAGAAEAGAVGLVGEGAETALGRVVQKGVALGVRGSVENASMGLSQAVATANLQDTPLNGEKLAGSMGYDALTGFLGGVVLGGGGQALSEARTALSPALRKAAAVEASKAIGLNRKIDKKMLAYLGKDANRQVGEELLDRGIVDVKADPATMLERTQAAREDVGKQIGQHLDDAAGYDVSGKGPLNARPFDIYKKFDELAEPYEGSASQGYVADQLHGMRDRFAKQFGLLDEAGELVPDPQDVTTSFKELHAETQRMGDQFYQQKQAVPDAASIDLEKGREMHRYLKDYVTDKLDEAEDAVGRPGWKEDYKALKSSYQKLSYAEEALKNKVASSYDLRRASLTDSILAAGGLATGHASGLAAGLGNNLLRTKGPQVAAWALNRVATMRAVQGEVTAFDRLTDRALNAYLVTARDHEEEAPLLPRVAMGAGKDEGEGTLVEEYDKHAANVRSAGMTPDLPGKVTAQLGDFAHHAPQAAQAVAATAQRGVAFLTTKLPPSPPRDPLRPALSSRPSATQMAKFMRYARAVDDPAGVLDDLRQNKLSPEAIESMKAVYPTIYSEVRKKVMDKIAERDAPMSYQARCQLAALFDVPAAPTLTQPSRAASLAVYAGQASTQAANSPADGKQKASKGKAGSHKVDLGAFAEPTAGDTLESYATSGSAGKD